MGAAEHLSANLIALRAGRQTSLVAFAEELGISKSTLQEIEKGSGTTLGTLEQIARSLNVSPALLLSETPSQTAPLFSLLHRMEWFSRWPEEDQLRFLGLLEALIALYAQHIDT